MPAAAKHRPLARGDACQSCKTRKIRCPAEKPACANCVKKGRECIYNVNNTIGSTDGSPIGHNEYQPNGISSRNSSANNSPTNHIILSGPSTSTHNQIHRPSVSNSVHSSSSFTNNDPSQTLPNSRLPLSATGISQIESNPPSYQPNYNNTNSTTPWTDAGMMGMLPSMMSPVQNLPSPWEDFDIAALIGQGQQVNDSDKTRIEDVELTEVERDHLLLLYFTGQRIFGIDMHISSFYNRLQSNDPMIRPHPCLLNAMYLMTCRGSPLESLRKQEKSFFLKAKHQMDHAIALPDFIFDAIRAGTMLCTWLFGSQRHMEGLSMLGQMIKLSIAVGLDVIKSSIEISVDPPPEHKRLEFKNFLRLPASHLELADRIYAFWHLYLVDRCVAIALDLPAGFNLERMTTPLPRAWAEYESNDPHLATCDQRLKDMYDGSSGIISSCGRQHIGEFFFTFCAVELMYQIALRPSKKEQDRLEIALHRFTSNLPVGLRGTEITEEGKPGVSTETAAIQSITLCAEMFLYQIDKTDKPDVRALEAARRILGILHLLKDAHIGDIGLFAIIIWCRTARLLVWECKRLEASGDTFAAAPYVKDVQLITVFLQQLAHISLAAVSLDDIKNWWSDDLSTFGWEHSSTRDFRH
ncbi:uncharacterized protein L201_005860 [Kwoniella dendrophila CBS 6074]|uniref:Zn(2)-C6 fungal-type domain-containing protein n=1 Tax=Kwoniella dendrophila CBS 6074 TaxID=1295534 RepID=A0AAX4K058_9TREE